MEEEMMDIVVFEDENGNEIEFEIQFSFEHKGEEYAVLTEVSEMERMTEEDAPDLYILRIVKNGDEEEFVAVDEDMMEELIDVVERIFEDELEEEISGRCRRKEKPGIPGLFVYLSIGIHRLFAFLRIQLWQKLGQMAGIWRRLCIKSASTCSLVGVAKPSLRTMRPSSLST